MATVAHDPSVDATDVKEKINQTEAQTSPTATSSAAAAAVSVSQEGASTVDMAAPDPSVDTITLRDSTTRPVYKLSIKLIETYKHINKVYYEAKAQRLKEQKDTGNRTGVHNDGYDDANYDYILGTDEIFADRYIIKHKMGKGSFGQVVCAYDQVLKCEVAVKIIKSRKPFLVQAQTEIELLNKILEQDEKDECNVVRLLNHFVYRNHQCLVFEILSFNLYELLKNTKFRGVSLNLTRKFSRYLLVALELLASPEVNIIHCDLKPENILLRHPRRSAIKLIDFGSSCYLTKRTYSYIQSRFYRSPEVLLGLPYTQKIDMWSLGCVAVEMHTGEPLFGGLNQADQICRMVDILGMPPVEMILRSPEKVRTQFFERIRVTSKDGGAVTKEAAVADAASAAAGDKEAPNAKDGKEIIKNAPSSSCDMNHIVYEEDKSTYFVLKRPANREQPKPRQLIDILGVHTGGPSGRRAGEADHTPEKYLEFFDFVQKLLVYTPELRANATELLQHPYIVNTEYTPVTAPPVTAAAATADDATAAANVATAVPAVDASVRSLSAPGTSIADAVTSSSVVTDKANPAIAAVSALDTSAAVTSAASNEGTAVVTAAGAAPTSGSDKKGAAPTTEVAAIVTAEAEAKITPLPDIGQSTTSSSHQQQQPQQSVGTSTTSVSQQSNKQAASAAASVSSTVGLPQIKSPRALSAPATANR